MRLRFTIRDLLWLMLVAALAVGWLLDHRHPRFSTATYYRGPGGPFTVLSDRETGQQWVKLDK
jgi:hypothetical protein